MRRIVSTTGCASIAAVAAALLVTATACTKAPADPQPERTSEWTHGNVTFRATGSDSIWALRLLAASAERATAVEQYLAARFTGRVLVTIFPSRNALTEYWRVAWRSPSFVPECWMVAGASATDVSMLSPALWLAQACNNRPDSAYVVSVVHHEMVHVLHLQQTPGLVINDMRWFFEGLASVASGQYTTATANQARAMIEGGVATPTLAALANAENAYVLAPSLVGFIEQRWGLEIVRTLARTPTTSGMLAALGTAETRLIADWRAWLTGGG